MNALTVIKVGGSLGRSDKLAPLCEALSALGRRHDLLVVPGGGALADQVRVFDRRYQLSDSTSHWMAVLAMEQMGYLLADLVPNSVLVSELAHRRANGRLDVLLPFDLLRKHDPLPHSWDVTSDSIAAWVARQACASQLVLLKDVDGLYAQDPAGQLGAQLLAQVDADQLSGCAGVDNHLARLIAGAPFQCWILNGQRPDRLETLLAGGEVTGTRILTGYPLASEPCVH